MCGGYEEVRRLDSMNVKEDGFRVMGSPVEVGNTCLFDAMQKRREEKRRGWTEFLKSEDRSTQSRRGRCWVVSVSMVGLEEVG